VPERRRNLTKRLKVTRLQAAANDKLGARSPIG
jgi:hypothetical protein